MKQPVLSHRFGANERKTHHYNEDLVVTHSKYISKEQEEGKKTPKQRDEPSINKWKEKHSIEHSSLVDDMI